MQLVKFASKVLIDMEQYEEVPLKENGEAKQSESSRFVRINRGKYWKIFPSYFPQVIAVITGKKSNKITFFNRYLLKIFTILRHKHFFLHQNYSSKFKCTKVLRGCFFYDLAVLIFFCILIV